VFLNNHLIGMYEFIVVRLTSYVFKLYFDEVITSARKEFLVVVSLKWRQRGTPS